MTSDGTNSYERDAENRLVKISYPGIGNNSSFAFDGSGRNVSILEVSGGLTTSQRQFVWCDFQREEIRDGNGSILSLLFEEGQLTGSAKLFYALNHLGSVTELTSFSGLLEGQLQYDPFGMSSPTTGVSSEIGFSGYYGHARSGLLLPVFRVYSASTGRWLSRDPSFFSESGSFYRYAGNNPANGIDSLGLFTLTEIIEYVKKNNKSKYLSHEFVISQIWKETNFSPRSPKGGGGASGLMQVQPDALTDLNANQGTTYKHSQMKDPATSIQAGTQYADLRIERAGNLREGMNGYGTGTGYANDILECERCLKEKFRKRDCRLTPCLHKIHQ